MRRSKLRTSWLAHAGVWLLLAAPCWAQAAPPPAPAPDAPDGTQPADEPSTDDVPHADDDPSSGDAPPADDDPSPDDAPPADGEPSPDDAPPAESSPLERLLAGEDPDMLSEEERQRRLTTAPPPEFAARKPLIPQEILLEKREGRNTTGFPEIGWDQENGVVLGAQLQLFLNGTRDDGLFASAPYRARTLIAGRRTSEGVTELEFGVDVPYVLDSPYRVRLGLSASQTPIANYYGVGKESMERLSFPGQARAFTRRARYADALRRSPDGLTTYARYDQWRSTSLRSSLRVERDLLQGVLRPLLGFALSYRDVDDYTNRGTRAKAPFSDVRARQLTTRLRQDRERGRIRGFRGGFDQSVKLGLTYDTRDFEPDPARGWFVMAASDISSRYLGSDFDYQRVSLTATGYLRLLPRDMTRLVLAGRIAYSTVFGAVPFYELGSFARTDEDLSGLGGYQTLRGYQRSRFVGRSLALASAELRWAFAELRFLGDHFRLMAVAFVDAGRAFERPAEFHLRNWRYAYGAAFRFSWNLSTVISFDYGVSREDGIFYVSIGHPF